MIAGSLFAGIGGLERGLELAGLVTRVAWQVEIEPFPRAILARHFPAADRSVTDVRAASRATLAPVDLVCGGFPCQDTSGAGKRAGLAGVRSGLWYEYRRILEEMRPALAIVENPASGKARWLCSVRRDLHALGYRARAIQVSAADCGAPHRRARIFVVAYSNGLRELEPQRVELDERRRPGRRRAVADADSFDLWEQSRRGGGKSRTGSPEPREAGQGLADAAGERRRRHLQEEPEAPIGDERPAQSGVGRDAHGLPGRLDRAPRWPAGRGEEQFEWEPPRTAAKVPHRPARLRALGNAVSPWQGYVVGRFVVEEILGLAEARPEPRKLDLSSPPPR